YQYWRITDNEELAGRDECSVYYTGTETEITTKVGFDVAWGTNVTLLKYDRSGETEAHDVVIRTNSYDTVVTINAPTDTVRHYDKANKIDITAVASASYHEYGDVLGNINLASGRVVAESSAKAAAIVIIATAEAINDEANPVVINVDNTAAPTIPIVVPAEVKAAIDAKAGAGSNYGITTSDENSLVSYESSAEAFVVGKGSYPKLSEAISSAQDGDTVLLLTDCTLDAPLGIYKNITLDLVGNTITYSSNGYAVSTQGKVLIKNGGIVAEGSAPSGCINIMDGSKTVLYGLSLVEQYTNYTVFSSDADLTIDYCTLKSNSTVISVSGGNLTVSNTTLMPYNLTRAILGIEYTGDGNVMIGENTVIDRFTTGIKFTAGDFAPTYTIADSVKFIDCVEELQLVGMPQNITEGGDSQYFNGGKINISGTPEFTGITNFTGCTFNISGGTFGQVAVTGGSTGTISGGTFSVRLGVIASTLTITGGTFNLDSGCIGTMAGGVITIKGGKFTSKPADNLLAEGYNANTTEEIDGITYYVVKAN
ncbi:MAG: hypothetical protein ACI3XQ_00230, partial [Eubacteriales bacterium]